MYPTVCYLVNIRRCMLPKEKSTDHLEEGDMSRPPSLWYDRRLDAFILLNFTDKVIHMADALYLPVILVVLSIPYNLSVSWYRQQQNSDPHTTLSHSMKKKWFLYNSCPCILFFILVIVSVQSTKQELLN